VVSGLAGALSSVSFLGKYNSFDLILRCADCLLPSIGDVIDAFMAMMVLRTCQQVEGGLPNEVKAKMLFNIVLDFGVGLVPFLGDIADGRSKPDIKESPHVKEQTLTLISSTLPSQHPKRRRPREVPPRKG
jgi:hypothetical protein